MFIIEDRFTISYFFDLESLILFSNAVRGVHTFSTWKVAFLPAMQSEECMYTVLEANQGRRSSRSLKSLSKRIDVKS